MSRPSPNAVLIFGDETYPDGSGGSRIIYSAVAVRVQDLISTQSEIDRISGLRGKERSKHVLQFFDNPAFLVSVLTIDRNEVHPDRLFGETDEYPDIGPVSRVDELWAQAFGYSVAALLPYLVELWGASEVRVYYDRRDLTKALRESTHGAIVDRLTELATQHALSLKGDRSLTVTEVKEIAKPKAGSGDLYQRGTWLADQVGHAVRRVNRQVFTPNFRFFNETDLVKEVERFKRSQH